MALHIALLLQKKYQGTAKGNKRNINQKGSIVLIFDNEHREQQPFTNLLLSPPDWTNSYYKKKKEQDKMSQIIDVPHFVDSKQVGLIQLADFICFLLRKYIEIQMGLVEPKYENEKDKIKGWVDQIISCSISKRIFFHQKVLAIVQNFL
jgi:hypothetical protein